MYPIENNEFIFWQPCNFLELCTLKGSKKSGKILCNVIKSRSHSSWFSVMFCVTARSAFNLIEFSSDDRNIVVTDVNLILFLVSLVPQTRHYLLSSVIIIRMPHIIKCHSWKKRHLWLYIMQEKSSTRLRYYILRFKWSVTSTIQGNCQ